MPVNKLTHFNPSTSVNPEFRPTGFRSLAHCRFTRRSAGVAPMAVTAVSRPVVVDEGSFLDALFAPAGQDRRAMEHRPQDPGPRRRKIDWRLDDRGALEARLGNVFNEHQVWNSNLIRSL